MSLNNYQGSKDNTGKIEEDAIIMNYLNTKISGIDLATRLSPEGELAKHTSAALNFKVTD